MPEALVTRERHGDVLVLRLNRPEHGNAINLELAQALAAAVAAVTAVADGAADRSLRALIITGAGAKFFCSGGDVKAYALVTSATELNRIFDAIRDLLDAIEALPLPVIAAINGYAIGGGAELALACDLRVIDCTAQIGFPQSRLGIIPGWDGIERLVALIGRAAATRLLLTGTRISAEDALSANLVDEVAPEGESLARALALAHTFAETAPLSIAALKTALRDASYGDAAGNRMGARVAARDAFARLWFTADHKEAERAFAEKRKPQFSGN